MWAARVCGCSAATDIHAASWPLTRAMIAVIRLTNASAVKWVVVRRIARFVTANLKTQLLCHHAMVGTGPVRTPAPRNCYAIREIFSCLAAPSAELHGQNSRAHTRLILATRLRYNQWFFQPQRGGGATRPPNRRSVNGVTYPTVAAQLIRHAVYRRDVRRAPCARRVRSVLHHATPER